MCLFTKLSAQVNPSDSCCHDLSQYAIRTYTIEDGLPSNALNDFLQTPDGYLWIASYQGIIRFDGFDFEIFNTENTDVFQSNNFRSILAGDDGTLFFEVQSHPDVAYKDGRFIIPDSALMEKRPAVQYFFDWFNEDWTLPPYEEIFYFRNNELHFPAFDTVFKNVQINNRLFDSNGDLYLATSIGLFKISQKEFIHYNKENGLKSDFVISLLLLDDSRIMIGTYDGLFYFNGLEFVEDPGFRGVGFKQIIKTKKGDIYMATKKGLYRIKAGSDELEHFTEKQGLADNHVIRVYVDDEEDIWLYSHMSGLSKLNQNKFILYNEKDGLSKGIVNTVCSCNPQSFYVGLDNGLVYVLSKDTMQRLRLKTDISGLRIRHIFKDSKENIWLSSYGGLLKINSNGSEKWFDRDNGFPSSLIRLVYEDSDAIIWVGTREAGLIKMGNKGIEKIFNTASGLSANLIMSLEEDNQGQLVVGTSGGGIVFLKDDQVVDIINKDSGLVSNVVFNTYCDDDGVIWVATNMGISRIENDEITNITTDDGLANQSPFDIVEDDRGLLWMPFAQGLMSVSKEALNDYAKGKLKKISCRLYDENDGVPGEGFTPVAQSVKSENGEIWIPSLDGVLSISPHTIKTNKKPPPVYIQSMITENDTIDIDEEIRISANTRRVTIRFSAICLRAPEKVRFKYILEGYDTEWTEVNSDKRVVSYTNLPNGQYTFRVIACNNDGVWNMQGDSVSFLVEPYWFETIIFIITALILLILLFFLFAKLRTRRLEARQKKLEVIIDERTREIQTKNKQLEELNATKDKFFNIIAHDLKSPFNSILGLSDILNTEFDTLSREEVERSIELIHDSGKKVYDLLENLLEWARSQTGNLEYNPENIQLKPLIKSVTDTLQINLGTKNISLKLNIEDDIIAYGDLNMLRTVFRNLISNAIKFTYRNGDISINARKLKSDIIVSIEDSGVGMADDQISDLFKLSKKSSTRGTEKEMGTGLGLILCKEFINKNNGSITVKSEPGKGSEFTVILPSSK